MYYGFLPNNVHAYCTFGPLPPSHAASSLLPMTGAWVGRTARLLAPSGGEGPSAHQSDAAGHEVMGLISGCLHSFVPAPLSSRRDKASACGKAGRPDRPPALQTTSLRATCRLGPVTVRLGLHKTNESFREGAKRSN